MFKKLIIGHLQTVRSGYINFTDRPIPSNLVKSDECVVLGYNHLLDQLLPQNDFEEIIFDEPMNTLAPDDIVLYIKKWTNKLISNGVLKVCIVDSRKVGLGLSDNSLSLPEAHKLLLGEPGNDFKSVIDIPVFKTLIQEVGLKVNMINIDNYHVIFELIK